MPRRKPRSARAALLSSGLSEAWILSEAFGEANPISISRNPSDALNRRVDVIVQPVKIKAEVIEAEERRLRGD